MHYSIRAAKQSFSSHGTSRHKLKPCYPSFCDRSTFMNSVNRREYRPSTSEVRLQETCIDVKTYRDLRRDQQWKEPMDQIFQEAVTYMKSAPLKRVQHPLDEDIVESFLWSIASALLTLLVSIPCSVLLVILAPFALLCKIVFQAVSSFSFIICFKCFVNSVSAHDAQFLLQDDESIVQCIIILDGSVHISRIRETLYNRIISIRSTNGSLMFPKLTQILCNAKIKPYWQTDKDFCVDNHVFSGPNISSDAGLQLYASKILTKPLNLSRPLWEVVVVNGVSKGTDTVLIIRIHQCIGDGMSLLKALCQSLCDNHIAQIPSSPHFGGVTYGASLLKSFFIGPLTILKWCVRSSELNLLTYKRHEKSPSHNKKSKPDIERGNGHLDLYNVIAGGFVVAYDSDVPLCSLLRIKQVTRSCINEVLLASLAGALRSTLQQLGIKNPPNIKANLTVDLRCHTSTFVPIPLGTKSSFVPFILPVSIDGAIPRIWKVRETMEEIKASSDAVISYIVVWWVYKCLPRKWAADVLSRLHGQSSLQYSSLPGPTTSLQLAGYSIKQIFNLSPPRPPLAVSVTAITYADRVQLAVVVKKTLINAEWMAKTILLEMQKQCEQMGNTLSYRRLPGEHRRSYFSTMSQNHACRPLNDLQESLAKVQIELQRVTEEYENEVRKRLQSQSNDFEKYPGVSNKTIVRSVSTETSAGPSDKRSKMRRTKSMGLNKHQSLDKREALSYRVKRLKEEFTELLSEIRRRKNVTDDHCRRAVGPISEEEDDVRQSRKRTLSVASVKSVSSVKSSSSIKSSPSPVGVRSSINSYVFPKDSMIWSS